MVTAAHNARVQARHLQQQVDARRREQHLRVAQMLRDREARASVIASARRQVQKWRRDRLCSQIYIDAWSELLADPDRAAALLESDSPRAVSMRQNSPFAAYLR